MALRAGDVAHFTVDEYLRLVDAEPELLEPTELVNGVIVPMSPESTLHAEAVRRVDALFDELCPGRSRRNGSVRLSDSSLWAPDVYVLREDADLLRRGGRAGSYPSAEELEVVVEVCVSTERQDLGDKLSAYAAEGIPTYWVVQPTGWAIVHREPEHGVYYSVTRIDLPLDYRDLTVDTFRV